MADHLVKLIHTDELQNWQGFPIYEAFAGTTVAQYKEDIKSAKGSSQPMLFISHRWETPKHPDPEGRQLKKLKALKDCYIIYDYTSFPQDKSTNDGRAALKQVLNAMNMFIDNVVIMEDETYMTRGWCLYEYISASLRHCIVCDEIKNPALVRLRNAVATHPNPPGIGATHREAVNAKNQFVLEAINEVLPVFGRSEYTEPGDNVIVQRLLIELLRNSLPKKQTYTEYVGGWKAMEWTAEELHAAFGSKLEWEPLQYDPTTPVFKPVVPGSIAKAVANGYKIQQQPEDFGREKYEMDFSGVRRTVVIIRVVVLIVIVLLLWGLYHLVRWMFGI